MKKIVSSHYVDLVEDFFDERPRLVGRANVLTPVPRSQESADRVLTFGKGRVNRHESATVLKRGSSGFEGFDDLSIIEVMQDANRHCEVARRDRTEIDLIRAHVDKGSPIAVSLSC